MSLDRLLYPTAKIQKLFDRRIILSAISVRADIKNGDSQMRAAIHII